MPTSNEQTRFNSLTFRSTTVSILDLFGLRYAVFAPLSWFTVLQPADNIQIIRPPGQVDHLQKPRTACTFWWTETVFL